MQCQFDNILNKKCSWSYRSQKTIHKHNMEADTNSLNVQSTFLIEALQNGSNTESEKSTTESKRNVSHQINFEKITCSASPENEENGSSEVKEKTKMLTNVEVLDKPESENILEISSLDNIQLPRSNSITSDTHNDQGLTYENTESFNSSSDEEVFQTRFTVQEKTFIYKDDQISNKNSASPESFVKDRKQESNMETSNIFPIIIQAKAYESKENDPTNQITFEMKQEITSKPQEDKKDNVDGNTLSVETGDSKNSSTQNSLEDNELKECNNKKDGNEISEDAKETESDNSLAQNAKESSDELANLVIQEFLNGSFDISAYQPERSSINIMEKSLISSNQSVNSKLHTNKRNIPENNKCNKKPFELFMATKKTKNDFNNNMDKDDWLSNSHHTSTMDLERKKSGRQTEDSKKAKIMTSRCRTRPKFITEKPKEINSKSSCKLDDKYLKAKKQRKVVNNRSFNLEKNINILNNFGRKEQDIEKIKTKHKTVGTKNYKKEKISTQFSYRESPIKKNSRNKRNSSLIASQKIKAIEKLENRESAEEICLELDDSNFDLSTIQTKDTNAKMLHHSKINHTLKSKNELKSDKICIQNISNISSNGLQPNSTRMKNFENSRVTRNKYKMFKHAFDTCNFIIKSPLEKNDTRITNKYFTSDIDYSDNHFILENENENFNSRKKETFKRKNKKNEITNIKNDISNEFLPWKNNTKNKIPFKNAETQCRKKTWDMLEKELLGELNGTQFTNNSSETVIVKKEKLIRKSNIKNSNLYTVSNRSMTQTVSKSTEGNRYNMQYKIQNTESKYLETRTNNAYNYRSIFDRIQQREISNKQNAILEKTIAAMERCTAEFIKPEVDVIESVKKTDRLQFTDIIDESDINETEFNSNRTFMANENEYLQNEILNVLKKSITRKKNKNLNRKSNISYNENNCQGTETEFENSNHNEHLKNSFVTTNCILDKNAEKTNENKNWALISLQAKQTNPWEKLMKELNPETDSDTVVHEKDTFKKLFPKTYAIKKNLDKEKICKQDRITDIENEVCKEMTINKEEILQSHTPETVNSNTTNIYTAEYTIESTRNLNKISKLDNESLTKKVEKPMKKIPRNTKVDKVQKVNSPKFKLQLEKGGSLKFKKYVSKSSSSSLEKFVKSKPNTKHAKNECPNDNKGKKKYKKYVKKLFSTEDTLPKNNIITEDKTGSKKIQNIHNEDFEDSKDQRKRVKNLISQNEDDFFSLSSSDSEVDNKKNQGSGLLFDLFEE